MTARPTALAVGLVAAIAAARARPARADIHGDTYSSTNWAVSIEAPKNWRLSEEKSYPSVLLWMLRRDPPGKMLLSAEPVDDTDALAYATRTAALLTQLGFTVSKPQVHSATGAEWYDFDNGRVFLYQAFLVSGGKGYALTLAAPDRRTRGQHFRAFDYALRSIQVRRPPPPLTPAENAPAAPPAPLEPEVLPR